MYVIVNEVNELRRFHVRVSHIIITSVQNPKRIYGGMYDDEPRKQWLRRMSIIELSINEEQTDSSSKGCMGSDSVLPI